MPSHRSPICATCQQRHDRYIMRNGKPALASYCFSCWAAYQRANRPKHRDLPDAARKRANTRAYSNILLKRGVIERKPCAVCGSEQAQMHHPDYSNARLVEWLCRPCHLKHHHEERTP